MSPNPLTPGPELEPKSSAGMRNAIVMLAVVVVGAGGYLGNRTLRHVERLNTQIDSLEGTVQRATEDAEAATERAVDAERSARVAATTRDQAEDDAEAAREQAANAVERATVANRRAAAAEETSIQAQEEARLTRERAEEIRRVAEAETNRLIETLGRIAETRASPRASFCPPTIPMGKIRTYFSASKGRSTETMQCQVCLNMRRLIGENGV